MKTRFFYFVISSFNDSTIYIHMIFFYSLLNEYIKLCEDVLVKIKLYFFCFIFLC